MAQFFQKQTVNPNHPARKNFPSVLWENKTNNASFITQAPSNESFSFLNDIRSIIADEVETTFTPTGVLFADSDGTITDNVDNFTYTNNTNGSLIIGPKTSTFSFDSGAYPLVVRGINSGWEGGLFTIPSVPFGIWSIGNSADNQTVRTRYFSARGTMDTPVVVNVGDRMYEGNLEAFGTDSQFLSYCTTICTTTGFTSGGKVHASYDFRLRNTTDNGALPGSVSTIYSMTSSGAFRFNKKTTEEGTTTAPRSIAYFSADGTLLRTNAIKGSYTNDTTAGAGGVLVGQMYWNTTNNSVHTKIS